MNTEKQIEKLEYIVSKGEKRFIIKTAIVWALLTGVITPFVKFLFFKGIESFSMFIVSLIFYCLFAPLFGYIMWSAVETKLHNLKSK